MGLQIVYSSVTNIMKILSTLEEFEAAWSRHPITLECSQCLKPFEHPKHYVQAYVKEGREGVHCSRVCSSLAKRRARHIRSCQNCGAQVLVREGTMTSRRNKRLTHHFCSQRCSGLYNAAHRTKGSRRAKLEVWLEEQLRVRYPILPIEYNQTNAIEAELDIYFPSLKLAIELNGVFHYEPIFGQSKLDDIQRRDQNKFAACQKRGIGLCIIDTSKSRYFKPKNSQQYLNIITQIVDEKLGLPSGAAPEHGSDLEQKVV